MTKATLCDLAGIEPPTHLEGVSLVPVLKDAAASVKDVIFHEYSRYKDDFMGHVVRTDRYRYVRWKDRKGELVAEELNDLESDPMEMSNLSKEQPDKASELAMLLR